MLQERRDAIDRERRMNEKEQKIKEQRSVKHSHACIHAKKFPRVKGEVFLFLNRRIQAQMETEARKREKIKWV